MTIRNSKHNKGFTVLFAVIVSAIVLAIGVSIANITLKQIVISSAGRESQIAFYAADSGAECALYQDLMQSNIFSTSTETYSSFDCFGQGVEFGDFPVVANGTSATTTFVAKFLNSNYCAKVKVSKHDGKTTIDSRGYNICPQDGVTNPRILERGLQIDY